MAGTTQVDPLAPPSSLTPVLLARSDASGVVSWCRCEVLALNELPISTLSDPALLAARAGAQAVASWLSERTEAPCQARLTGDFDAAGDSAAGAGFLAALRTIVGDRAPERSLYRWLGTTQSNLHTGKAGNIGGKIQRCATLGLSSHLGVRRPTRRRRCA